MTDKEAILSLKDGERYIVPDGDYGKAEVEFLNGLYLLSEIPSYGGAPNFNDHFGKTKSMK